MPTAPPILVAKLYAPPSRPELVPRSRLIARLNANLRQGTNFARRLTIVSAPAGFGKTTLVAQWLRSGDPSFAWLSLDENDNDPARFLAYLIAALNQVQAGFGATVQALLRTPQPPAPDVILTTLANEMAAIPTPFILALDDYHAISSPAIHQQLNFLLEYLPPHAHLVVVTREDPPVPISRLRARGHVEEIRQADLCFTHAEVGDFLRRTAGLDLASEDVDALARRTEGWAVGLHMAALSMQGITDLKGFIQSFTGSHRFILDYLLSEVMDRQPAHLQDFLLKSSILDRLSASLCDAVCEREDSSELLQTLDRSNLFVVPLDPNRQSYRYHRLFSELLRHRLRLAGRPPLEILHLRAKDWLEKNGYPEEAVPHALAAQDWAGAARLIGHLSDGLLKRGQVGTLLGWFKRIPDQVTRSDPELCLLYAWPLLLAGQYEPAEALLCQAESLAGQDAALLGQVAAAQAYSAQAQSDEPRLTERSERALALLPESEVTARGMVALNLGLAHWHNGRLVEAEKALDEALRSALAEGNDYAAATAQILLARNQAVRGHLRQAEQALRQVLETYPGLPILVLAHLDLGTLLYEWNDLPRSANQIQQALEAAQLTGNAEFQASGLMLLARLRLAQGDPAGSLHAAQQARRIELTRQVPTRTGSRITCLMVELTLALGDLEEAERWAQQGLPEGVDAHPFYRFLGLTRARLLIAQKRTMEADSLLQTAAATAIQAHWRYGLVAARVLQAIAAETRAGAMGHLTEALELAQPQGYIRTFADAGPALVPLLQEAARRGVFPEYIGLILAAFPEKGMTKGPAARQVGQLIETLSEREVEVLRLVAAGMSNREIARKLFLSTGTVKTHIHNIFGKLAAQNRAQAIARGKELGLI